MPINWCQATDNPRARYVASCLEISAATVCPEESLAIAVVPGWVKSPGVMAGLWFADEVSPLDLADYQYPVFIWSSAPTLQLTPAGLIRFAGAVFAPGPDMLPPSWINEKPSGSKLMTVVPDSELASLYDFMLLYFNEYRSTDAVVLAVYSSCEECRDVIDAAGKDSRVPVKQLADVRLHIRDWQAQDVAALSKWCDACILPWKGLHPPIEALLAMAAGRMVIATGWFSDGVLTNRVGIPLRFELLCSQSGNFFAEPEKGQLLSAMRIAVAHPGRDLYPARQAAKEFDAKNGLLFRNLCAFQGSVDE